MYKQLVAGVCRVWIGMYKQHVDGATGEGEVFRWTDCTPVSKWAVTDLVNTDNTGSCVGARGPSLLWAAYKCQNLFSFICESSGPTAGTIGFCSVCVCVCVCNPVQISKSHSFLSCHPVTLHISRVRDASSVRFDPVRSGSVRSSSTRFPFNITFLFPSSCWS